MGNPRAPRLAANPKPPLCQSTGLPTGSSAGRDGRVGDGVGRAGTLVAER